VSETRGEPPDEPPRSRFRALQSEWTPAILLALVTLSLALHAYTWVQVGRVRRNVRAQALHLAGQISAARVEVIAVEVPVRGRIPVRTDIPLKARFSAEVNTIVPIRGDIEVPINTGFTIFRLPVPLDLKVPVSANVPVNVDETLPISTTVELDLRLPVEIPIADTPLDAYLETLETQLRKLGLEF